MCFALIFGSVLVCIFEVRLISLFLVKTALMNTALAGSPWPGMETSHWEADWVRVP